MTEFTPKAEGITDVMRMVTGKDRVAGECVFDGPASGEGWEEQSHDLNFDAVNDCYGIEYGISGMCITCQNGVFEW